MTTVQEAVAPSFIHPDGLPIHEEALAVAEVAPEPVNLDPSVRAATINDLDAIVGVEISAFYDVYGVDPTPETIADIREKYVGRIELLGDLVRVLERPDRGVYGVMVCCTTNYGKEDFLAETRDLTDNGTIRDIYDPNGKGAYIVNLAVHRDYQGGERFNLFADAIQLGMELGVEKAYFESRLPGFDSWAESWPAQEYCRLVEESGQPRPTDADLVNVYWQLKQSSRRGGAEKPIDPLLRMYVNIGAEPLRLIEDAWKPDKSSRSFGVLCEYQLPQTSSEPEATVDGGALEVIDGAVDGAEPDKSGLLHRTVEWFKTHKLTSFLGGTAIAGLVYSAAQPGGTSEMLDGLKETGAWAVGAYGVSWAAMLAGAAMMLVGAGKQVNFKNLLKRPGAELADAYIESPLVRTGFKVNALGAAAAAGTVILAVAESLPPGAWVAALPAIVDLYSTVALRAAAMRSVKERKLSATTQ